MPHATSFRQALVEKVQQGRQAGVFDPVLVLSISIQGHRLIGRFMYKNRVNTGCRSRKLLLKRSSDSSFRGKVPFTLGCIELL